MKEVEKNQNNSKKSVLKSSRFPSISLDYAVSVISQISTSSRKISDLDIAGGKSPKSGAFDRKKASLRYFGLIEGQGDKLQITTLAEKIVHFLSEEERNNAIKEAFLSPDLFRKLYDSRAKNVGMKLDFLKNLVIREYGIQPSATDEFVSTFVKSGVYAGLVSYVNDSQVEIILSDDVSQNVHSKTESENSSYQEPSKGKEIISNSDLHTYNINGILLQIPVNEKVDQLILMGGLSEVTTKIIEFAKQAGLQKSEDISENNAGSHS